MDASCEDYDWLGHYLFESLNALQAFATNWLWTYNHERPNMALGGYTPKQRLAQVPGRVFTAEVMSVIPALAAGNVQANAGLIDQTSAQAPGRLPIALKITDPDWPKYQVIAGSSGQAAIYTKYFPQVSIIRKVLLRMTSWLNYLFPFH